MGKVPATPRPPPRPAPYPTAISTPNTAYEPRTPPPTDRQHNSAWSPENDTTLQELRQQGLNWTAIADHHFPDKTPNACRKRYERLMEKKQAADSWDGAKMEELGRAYAEMREQMWQILAERINEKWTTVETKVCSQFLAFMNSAHSHSAWNAVFKRL